MNAPHPLTDQMHRAVDDAHLDVDALVAGSRRRGLAIRRRRQALSVIGGVAAVGLAATTMQALGAFSGGAPRPAGEATTFAGSPTPTPAPQDSTRPATGRATAAALLSLVRAEQPGEAWGFQGQSPDPVGEAATWATFDWKPATGGTGTPVQINVQPGFEPDPGFYSCAGRGGVTRCSVTRLPDGALLMRYEMQQRTSAGLAVDRTVDRLGADGVRVVATSTNRDDIEKGRVVRSQPPLSYPQLRAVVSARWWGPTLPARFTAQGAELQPFEDLTTSSTESSAQPIGPGGGAVPSATPAPPELLVPGAPDPSLGQSMAPTPPGQ